MQQSFRNKLEDYGHACDSFVAHHFAMLEADCELPSGSNIRKKVYFYYSQLPLMLRQYSNLSDIYLVRIDRLH